MTSPRTEAALQSGGTLLEISVSFHRQQQGEQAATEVGVVFLWLLNCHMCLQGLTLVFKMK